MISGATGKHEKHAKLARAAYGEWGRFELAIAGTTCDDIKDLADRIIQSLPAYKIAYVDSEHNSPMSLKAGNVIEAGRAFTEYTDKNTFTHINTKEEPNTFQKRAWLQNCDLILVNGNHFTGSRQIVVIDERKPLEKKLDKLTSVEMIVKRDLSAEVPDYLMQHISGIAEVPHYSFTDGKAIGQHLGKYLQQQIPIVNGLVLSGGQSTRMGADKGNLHYHNKSQREYVFDMLCSRCSETFISCNAEQSKEIVSTPKIEDSFLGLGPLSGILSAFQRNPDAAWLTVACDLPFLNEDTIAYLFTHRNPSKVATAFWDAEGQFPEPLVTIWEPRAYPVLLQFLAQGYNCPRKVLMNSDVELLRAPNKFAFTNVNTREEHEEALLLLQKLLV